MIWRIKLDLLYYLGFYIELMAIFPIGEHFSQRICYIHKMNWLSLLKRFFSLNMYNWEQIYLYSWKMYIVKN